MATHMPVTENTLITIKITILDSTRKIKLPLKDLGADKLIPKLRYLLLIKSGQGVVFERYSDSVGDFVVLDPANPAVFKTLVRAAKAKLKLRLKATVSPLSSTDEEQEESKNKAGASLSETARLAARGINPSTHLPMRGSTAFDQRSLGPGIFQFRDPPSSPKLVLATKTKEEPVPCAYITPSTDFFAELAAHGREHELSLLNKNDASSNTTTSWSVYCNECDTAMDDVHFHCGICDGGDYDLCEACVDNGKFCPGEGHWLIKRSMNNGKIVASTTERLAAPGSRSETALASPVAIDTQKTEGLDNERDIPGAYADDVSTLNAVPEDVFRTCNNCIACLPDKEFLTCANCDDYDLCRTCHVADKHGHNPAHHFEPAVPGASLTLAEKALLPAGRNTRHNAICDGCDKNIFGVRHKCFSCPDFDYCNDCVKNARRTHPRHRFAPLYEPVALAGAGTPVTHLGIYCDGPLCKDNSYQAFIKGVRYKCVVCHDLDFCASCEALPGNLHNKTHPLIKFKTPINNVSISTQNEDKSGRVRVLGDKYTTMDTNARLTTNSTTSVKTLADIQPTQKSAETLDVAESTLPATPKTLPIRALDTIAKGDAETPLEAHFVRDAVVDGTVMAPATPFMQVWTIRNPGPRSWPAGCSVRFVGGDNMLNHTRNSIASADSFYDATESNVIAREVQPGEEVAFKVLMKAPTRHGKSISYWRVKAADGTPFGHKLWCDIVVKDSEQDAGAEPKSEDKLQDASSANMAKYWAGYQQRMASIRLANAERQAELRRGAEARLAGASRQPREQSGAEAMSSAREQMMKQMEEFVRRTKVMNNDVAQSAPSHDDSKTDMSVKTSLAASSQEAAQDKKDEAELRDSQMIFPTLERESPANSAYDSLSTASVAKDAVASVEDGDSRAKAGNAEPTSTPADKVADVVAQKPDEEAFEDISELEVLSADGEDEDSDDGFMTDEEYDILDASDQETVASR
ncbi:hypothetical protein AAFC00_000968 [Neodothiora populina]|uniref:ZZ-type domain-containing protein n=1 Tax=Neodothiora populina TaxID=2781224 RepID=A0ABR3PMC8_9PEZI